MRRILVGLVALVICLSLARVSAAQDGPPPFVVVPAPTDAADTTERGYFVYHLAAGAQQTGAVLLQNTSAQTTTITLAAVDAQTSQNGGSAFADTATPPTAIGTWLTLATPTVTLGPKRERTVPFTVTVPRDARPKQYLAGIAAQATPSSDPATPMGTSTVVHVETRYVLAVQVEVPGAWTPALEIPAVRVLQQPQGAVLGVDLRNTGDTFVTTTGTLVLRDQRSATILTQPIDLGTFVTGTEITHLIAWPSALPLAPYEVEVTLHYATNQTAHYRGQLTVPPGAAQAVAAMPQTEGGAQVLAPLTTAPPWILYGLAGLLVLVAVLLVINLIVGRTRRRTERGEA